eukprot:jgi/Tetstr1/426780/TSEL_016995.t1
MFSSFPRHGQASPEASRSCLNLKRPSAGATRGAGGFLGGTAGAAGGMARDAAAGPVSHPLSDGGESDGYANRIMPGLDDIDNEGRNGVPGNAPDDTKMDGAGEAPSQVPVDSEMVAQDDLPDWLPDGGERGGYDSSMPGLDPGSSDSERHEGVPDTVSDDADMGGNGWVPSQVPADSGMADITGLPGAVADAGESDGDGSMPGLHSGSSDSGDSMPRLLPHDSDSDMGDNADAPDHMPVGRQMARLGGLLPIRQTAPLGGHNDDGDSSMPGLADSGTSDDSMPCLMPDSSDNDSGDGGGGGVGAGTRPARTVGPRGTQGGGGLPCRGLDGGDSDGAGSMPGLISYSDSSAASDSGDSMPNLAPSSDTSDEEYDGEDEEEEEEEEEEEDYLGLARWLDYLGMPGGQAGGPGGEFAEAEALLEDYAVLRWADPLEGGGAAPVMLPQEMSGAAMSELLARLRGEATGGDGGPGRGGSGATRRVRRRRHQQQRGEEEEEEQEEAEAEEEEELPNLRWRGPPGGELDGPETPPGPDFGAGVRTFGEWRESMMFQRAMGAIHSGPGALPRIGGGLEGLAWRRGGQAGAGGEPAGEALPQLFPPELAMLLPGMVNQGDDELRDALGGLRDRYGPARPERRQRQRRKVRARELSWRHLLSEDVKRVVDDRPFMSALLGTLEGIDPAAACIQTTLRALWGPPGTEEVKAPMEEGR